MMLSSVNSSENKLDHASCTSGGLHKSVKGCLPPSKSVKSSELL